MELVSSGTNFLLILLGFGLLIGVHELGHFLAARWAGIRVDAFAVGMGPPVLAYRRGVGWRFGSTDPLVVARAGGLAATLPDARLAELGIGETEYSLRALPLGGFVRMLGQDDLDPNATSESARSYNRCPVGKRLVVVSAGVVANLVLAVLLFLVAFLAGVRFEAPLVGAVLPGSPAATAVAVNGEDLGVELPGLAGGDRILRIDGESIATFADVQIAAAMSRPDRPLEIEVERPGVASPLRFSVEPRADAASGLLSIGITPAAGVTLASEAAFRPVVERLLERTGLAAEGVSAGMTLRSVAGLPVRTFDQVQAAAAAGDGEPLPTRWSRPDGGEIDALLPVEPVFSQLAYPIRMAPGVGDFEFGLLGLTPLVRIEEVLAESPNVRLLEPGDLVLRVADLDGPRMAEFREQVQSRRGESIRLLVARGGEERLVEAEVDRQGRLGVAIAYERSVPIAARPFDRLGVPTEAGLSMRASAASRLSLLPRTRIVAVEGDPIGDWAELREALLRHTGEAAAAGEGTTLAIELRPPTPDAATVTEAWPLEAAEIAELHTLGWAVAVPAELFDPVHTVLSADGRPWTAVAMGFEQTAKMVTLTYLTIDRLLRGTVGVEQLHGPVGIVHLGTRVADRGFMYLVFFLAMISVNLAVLNFLPLPIVDGGLAMFLIYEKLRGRPPSPAFQSGATLAGLLLIGSLFVVTFYNDLVRLFG